MQLKKTHRLSRVMSRWLLAVLSVCLMATAALAQGRQVSLELWKKYDDSLSMGNNAVVSKGELIEENGKTYLILTMVPLETRGFKGYLGSMTAKDRTITVKSCYDGIYDDFNHPETGTDALLKGKPYPKVLQIPVEGDEEFIEVSVYVPVMAMLGVGEQDARLKVLWDKATPATAATAPAAAPATTQPSGTAEACVKNADGYYEPKPGQTPLTLQDGLYRIPVELYHSVEDKNSMGDGALGDYGEILVKDGRGTLYIQSRKMTVMDITASLISLYYEGTDGRYYRAMTHDHSLAFDEEIFCRPSVLSLPLAGADTFVPVYVDPKVEPMGDDPIKARLKLHFDQIKPIAEKESALLSLAKNGAEETPFDPQQAYTLRDKGVELVIEPASFTEKPHFYANRITGAKKEVLQEKHGALAQVDAYLLETLGGLESLDPGRPNDMNHQRETLHSAKPLVVTIPVVTPPSAGAVLYVEGENVPFETKESAIVFTTAKLGVVEIVSQGGGAAPLANGTPSAAVPVMAPKSAPAPVKPVVTPPAASASVAVSPQTATVSLADQMSVVNENQTAAANGTVVVRESGAILYAVPVIVIIIGGYFLLQKLRLARQIESARQLAMWKMEDIG